MKNIKEKDAVRCEKNVLNKGNYQSYAVRPVSMKLSKGKEWNYPSESKDSKPSYSMIYHFVKDIK